VGAAMSAMFASDLETATYVDPAALRARPAWQRAIEAVASAFSPNL
jgi:hypothetical protein